MTAAKMAIRALFPAGQDAVHSTDTHEEALRAAGYLLNANSIDLLNRAPARSFPRFERLVAAFLGWIAEHGLDRREFCLDGSAVLAAYGVRDCADLDFLHHPQHFDEICNRILSALDQRDSRLNFARTVRRLGAMRVLNCYCYTGGFTVAALMGGAERVVSVDSSGPALMQARFNVALNGLDDDSHLSTLEGRILSSTLSWTWMR